MNLLLLGCTGFIGSELVPQLIKSGHRLTILSRKPRSALKGLFQDNEINFLHANPAHASSWNKEEILNALRNSEGVINLVGEPIAEKRWTNEQCNKIKNSRLNTTKYLVKAIKIPYLI